MAAMLRVAGLLECTRVEGPHARLAVWVAGCTLGCLGCCNPQMLDAGRGELRSVDEILAARGPQVEGVTILGGEPLQQLGPVAALARQSRRQGLGVVLFTGYRLTEARARRGFAALWPWVDTIVTGRFDGRRPEPNAGRGWIGSSNQRVLHQTARYRDPALWVRPPAAEVRLDADGSATVVGTPRLVAQVRRRLRGDG